MNRQELIRNEAAKERTQMERDAFFRGAMFAEVLNGKAMSKEDVFANAAKAGITRGLLRSSSRLRPLAYARVAVAHMLRQLGWSSTAIGNELNRDHTTILAMWANADEWFANPQRHKSELALMQDVLAGRRIKIPKPKLKRAKAAPTNQGKPVREALCVECALYPCFQGIENFESNFAETCKSFRYRQ